MRRTKKKKRTNIGKYVLEFRSWLSVNPENYIAYTHTHTLGWLTMPECLQAWNTEDAKWTTGQSLRSSLRFLQGHRRRLYRTLP